MSDGVHINKAILLFGVSYFMADSKDPLEKEIIHKLYFSSLFSDSLLEI